MANQQIRVGTKVKHPHFKGTGKVQAFSHEGKVAVVENQDGIHYVKASELKRIEK